MSTVKRYLNIDLPPGKSAFLWGARKTGKTTYLRNVFPDSLVFDFLKTDLFFEFSKNPHRFREQINAKNEKILKLPIILDEVQKVPQILDEVHWLIENKNLSFILCGSSARKLKRGKANLLGGRAWRYELLPFVTCELEKFNLLRALNQGLIPTHYLENNYKKSLKAYTHDYLKEEVFQEGLTRNIPAFSRFFDAIGYSQGELTNFLNIARKCGVDSKTVREYYQILVDTLVGRFIPPFAKRQGRQVISKTAKFYLFDVGVAGYLTKREIKEERGQAFGQAFEHFILTEIWAYNIYNDIEFPIHFWRTKSGLEVDFILGDGEIALEIKSSSRVEREDLRALSVFIDEFKPKQGIVVCNERDERIVGNIHILPWGIFLERLWGGLIIK
jgi:predicted AAA+ superfamily ATPase